MGQQSNILLSIHGTSMRAIIALIEKEYGQNKIDFDTMSKLEIPNGYPVVYRFDVNSEIVIGDDDKQWIEKQYKLLKIAKIHGQFLGDLDNLMSAQDKVRNQIVKKTDTINS